MLYKRLKRLEQEQANNRFTITALQVCFRLLTSQHDVLFDKFIVVYTGQY